MTIGENCMTIFVACYLHGFKNQTGSTDPTGSTIDWTTFKFDDLNRHGLDRPRTVETSESAESTNFP